MLELFSSVFEFFSCVLKLFPSVFEFFSSLLQHFSSVLKLFLVHARRRPLSSVLELHCLQ